MTRLFISKYFDLKNPDKWIPKKELISNIKNEIKKIKDILNNFNLLQIDNDEIFIEDYIPCNVQYNIYKEIMNFFNTEEWQKILETKIQTFKEYFNIRNDEQIKNHNGKLSKIKSIYDMREINNYIDEEYKLEKLFACKKSSYTFFEELKNARKIAEIANDYNEKHLNDIDEDYDEL